ncbi:hypothetical protein C3L33_14892, partial [Rhododendron williamsianum]
MRALRSGGAGTLVRGCGISAVKPIAGGDGCYGDDGADMQLGEFPDLALTLLQSCICSNTSSNILLVVMVAMEMTVPKMVFSGGGDGCYGDDAEQYKDIENGERKTGIEDLEEPFIDQHKKVEESDEEDHEYCSETSGEKGSIAMVLLSTAVAVGYSAPTQSAIREELHLSLAEGALYLDMGRFLTGYGIGIFSFVLMIVTGVSTGYLLGTLITWRSLALTGLLPCIVIFFGLFFVPESPRWLVTVGKKKEFEAALRKLRGKDADISREAAEIQAYIEALQSLPKSRMTDLFDRKYIRSVIIGVGLMFFQQFGGINGVSFYVSETFAAAGISGNVGTIAYAIIQVYVASFSIGMGAVPWVIMSEGAAGSLVVLVNWLGAWAVSFTFNFLMSWSSTGTFFVYSAFCALTVLFVAKVVPETKGKTFEEIQADINR